MNPLRASVVPHGENNSGNDQRSDRYTQGGVATFGERNDLDIYDEHDDYDHYYDRFLGGLSEFLPPSSHASSRDPNSPPSTRHVSLASPSHHSRTPVTPRDPRNQQRFYNPDDQRTFSGVSGDWIRDRASSSAHPHEARRARRNTRRRSFDTMKHFRRMNVRDYKEADRAYHEAETALEDEVEEADANRGRSSISRASTQPHLRSPLNPLGQSAYSRAPRRYSDAADNDEGGVHLLPIRHAKITSGGRNSRAMSRHKARRDGNSGGRHFDLYPWNMNDLFGGLDQRSSHGDSQP